MRGHIWCDRRQASLLRGGKTWGPTTLFPQTASWTMENQETTLRLGRRPAEQGPRPLLRNQGRVRKSVTGSTKAKQIEPVQLRKKLRIGTWNIRTLLQLGKLQVLGREMDRIGVDICGLSEVRWKGQGHFTTREGHTVIYSGEKVQGHQGVAIWMHKKVAGALIGYEPINSRLLVVRINAKPRCISLIQVYAPTSGSDELTVNQFYQDLSEAVKHVPARDILMVIGDFNAKVGRTNTTPVVGPGGLGDVNDAGERLLDFCLDHELVLASTWFKHHPRRLYTWTSPDGNTKNQTDYIGISQRWSSCVSNCKTYPGADCDTDHNLLVATLKIRLGKKKKLVALPCLNLEELKEERAVAYEVEVKNRFEALGEVRDERTPEELWNETKEILLDAAKETIGFKKCVCKKTGISDDTFELINEKREMKQKNPARYKELKTMVQKRL